MKIIHTSDWHLGKNLDGNSRLAEQIEFLDYFVCRCEELKPDMILIAGDVYDTANPPAQAEELFYCTLKKLSRNGDCIIFVIAGNHDMPERLTAATPLAREHGIIMLGTLGSMIADGRYGKHTVKQIESGAYEIKFVSGELAVVIALPYPSESRLGEIFYNMNQDESDRAKEYGYKIGKIWEKLEENFRDDAVNIAVSHLFAIKDYKGSSERTATLGESFLVGAEKLPKRADYVALGHIHKPMRVDSEGRIRYSGSPLHYSVSEIGHEKKFIIIDCVSGEETKVTEEILPIFKPIVKWQAESIEQAIKLCREHQGEESWVYMEVYTDRPVSDSEIKEMKSLKKDIIEIHPKIKSGYMEEEIIKLSELSFEEQFLEYYKFKNQGMLPNENLMEIFREVLLEAQAEE